MQAPRQKLLVHTFVDFKKADSIDSRTLLLILEESGLDTNT